MILHPERQNQWVTPCKQGSQGQLEEMLTQSQYSLTISHESLQWQGSVKHLPSLLLEHTSTKISGPMSAYCHVHINAIMLVESPIRVSFVLEALDSHDCVCVMWQLAALSQRSMASASMIIYFNHHALNNLAKVCLFKSLVV
jgi:hypothetical protein